MKTYAIVMAAGKGTRMKSDKPKVVHEVLFKPMINHIIDELKQINVDQIYVIVGHKAEQVEALVKEENVTCVLQQPQLGTGHALMQVESLLANEEGSTIVLNGDAPLITKETLQELLDYHKSNNNKGTIMSCHCDLEKKFGRVIREDNNVTEIVEFKDLKPGQYEISEMNVGEYCFDNKELFKALKKVTNNNAQNEYYITDVVKIMNDDGLKVGGYIINDYSEVGGINDRIDLQEATKLLQRRVNKEHLLNGVNIIDIENTYIEKGVTIGEETTIEPGCIIKGNSSIGSGCHIGPYCEFTNVDIKDNVEIKFSVISDSIVESGTDIGPYARLRNNCHIKENVHIGNFVEMKKTTFGKDSKTAHFTYLGDSTVGERVNVGCGTFTANYDGKNKFNTIIEDDVFVGCNTVFVAPAKLGKNSFTAAGSVITKEVPPGDMAIARSKQVNKEDYVKVIDKKRQNVKK